jgi:hypothetical protein
MVTNSFIFLFIDIKKDLTNSSNHDKYSYMAVSKNNPGIRQEQKKKLYKGVELRPTLYIGKGVGKGTYMSGAINGELICDETGKPMQLARIPLDN